MSAHRARFTVVGIGADGIAGLGADARAAIAEADVVVGSERQLALVPNEIAARRTTWRTSLRTHVDELVAAPVARYTCVLASGDPLLHGVGALFADRLPADEVRIIPHVSAFALACARLGWPQAAVRLVSVVARPLAGVHPFVQPGARLIVYASDGATPAGLAELLRGRGFAASRMTLLANLGAAEETRRDGLAADWDDARTPDLCVVAVTCRADPGTRPLPTVPGLPDDAFEHDGQLTKREVRAAVLGRLVPLPGALLWDVGGGAGSVAIEWMRIDPSLRAVAIERDAARAARIERNAVALGAPMLRVLCGEAPAALPTGSGDAPDAIFLGGGLTTPGLLDAAHAALAPGGRLVASAVTIAGEAILAEAYARHGGELVRIAVTRADLVGTMPAWRPLMPVTLWATERA